MLSRPCNNIHDDNITWPLLSLRQGLIGFVKEKNRVNVLLSRAKEGLYILGHAPSFFAAMTYSAETSGKTLSMWNDVIANL